MCLLMGVQRLARVVVLFMYGLPCWATGRVSDRRLKQPQNVLQVNCAHVLLFSYLFVCKDDFGVGQQQACGGLLAGLAHGRCMDGDFAASQDMQTAGGTKNARVAFWGRFGKSSRNKSQGERQSLQFNLRLPP